MLSNGDTFDCPCSTLHYNSGQIPELTQTTPEHPDWEGEGAWGNGSELVVKFLNGHVKNGSHQKWLDKGGHRDEVVEDDNDTKVIRLGTL